MTNTPISLITPSAATQDPRVKQTAAAGFDAMMLNSDNNASFINDFLNNITSSMSGGFGDSTSSTLPAFPFSANFESTFGTSGPLPTFIDMITTKLHLSAAQNQAFQEIAVDNKDATNSPASVQKIAKELKAAGIGYA